MADFKQIIKYVLVICLILFSFSAGRTIQSRHARIALQGALAEHEITLRKVKTAQNKNASLTESLAEKDSENKELLDLVASLKARPAEVRYITQVETVVVSEPVLVTTELPDSHMFKMKNGLPVAQFTVSDGPSYNFETADLKVNADIIIAKDSSALSLRMKSSLDPDAEYELKVKEFEVTNTEEQRIFEPHVTLGGHISANPEGFSTGPHVGVSFVHLRNDIDLVQVGFGLSNQRPVLRLEPATYNVGKPLPVVTSVWLGLGVEMNALGQLGGTVSISGKL